MARVCFNYAFCAPGAVVNTYEEELYGSLDFDLLICLASGKIQSWAITSLSISNLALMTLQFALRQQCLNIRTTKHCQVIRAIFVEKNNRNNTCIQLYNRSI